MRVDLDEDTFCGVNVYLEQARLVKRRVEQCQETLGIMRWGCVQIRIGLPDG